MIELIKTKKIIKYLDNVYVIFLWYKVQNIIEANIRIL